MRETFTRAATAYTAKKRLVDRVSHDWMVELSEARPADSAVEIACGPGFITMRLAQKARCVVGVDLTSALLLQARAQHRPSRDAHGHFCEADAEHLHFPDQSVDLVACHKALHHFANAHQVLSEVFRILRTKGRFVLGDTLSSEDLGRRTLHNEIERVRDPAHVMMYAPSELRGVLGRAGFRIRREVAFEDERDFDSWMAIMPVSHQAQDRLRQMLIATQEGDRAGLGVRVENNKIYYRRRQMVIAAVKQAAS